MLEKFKFDNDITVVFKTANTFPDGIKDAHESLHTIVPFSKERRYFGLSRPEYGTIVYKAAAEIMKEHEASSYKLPTLVIKKGNYIAINVKDYMKDLSLIQKSFNTLLKQPGLDPDGYCVEWYVNNSDLMCMIKLQSDVLN